MSKSFGNLAIALFEATHGFAPHPCEWFAFIGSFKEPYVSISHYIVVKKIHLSTPPPYEINVFSLHISNFVIK